MVVNRRDVVFGAAPLIAGAALVASPDDVMAASLNNTSLNLSEIGLAPSLKKDQTALLQKAIDLAFEKKLRLSLPGGVYLSGPLTVRSGTHIEGVNGQTILRFLGGAGFVRGEKVSGVTLEHLVIDGGSQGFIGDIADGLLSFRESSDVLISHCEVKNSLKNGISLEGCSGAVRASKIQQCGVTGLYSIDATGLEVTHNEVTDCGNNGILIWRTTKGYDGSLVAQNRIERIKAEAGGTGQNGNGVNVFRAGNVVVSNNVIRSCVFSAVRNNAGDNVQILNNSCFDLGEVALYAEFGFEGAVISNNLVDKAHVGISITNFNEGGRLATASGNLIRNLQKRKGVAAIGIAVEADSMVTGNVIEDVDGVGISIGFDKYVRQVTANNNLVRKSSIGIGVSSHNEAGYVLIATNMISGSSNGAIRAMDREKPYGPDLSKTSTESFLNLAVYGNVSLK